MRSVSREADNMTIEVNRGFRKIFNLPVIYNWFQSLVLGSSGEWLFGQHWGLREFKGKVIDIGCGTALILNYLHKDAEYVGFDVNKEYISRASRIWGERPKTLFLNGDVKTLWSHPALKSADLIVCAGVLHHLSSTETEKIFNFISERLVVGGRFLSHEPCYLLRQGWVHRFFLNLDRGQGIRTEQGWKQLIARYFTHWQTDVLTGLIRIPYTHILMQGSKSK